MKEKIYTDPERLQAYRERERRRYRSLHWGLSPTVWISDTNLDIHYPKLAFFIINNKLSVELCCCSQVSSAQEADSGFTWGDSETEEGGLEGGCFPLPCPEDISWFPDRPHSSLQPPSEYRAPWGDLGRRQGGAAGWAVEDGVCRSFARSWNTLQLTVCYVLYILTCECLLFVKLCKQSLPTND